MMKPAMERRYGLPSIAKKYSTAINPYEDASTNKYEHRSIQYTRNNGFF